MTKHSNLCMENITKKFLLTWNKRKSFNSKNTNITMDIITYFSMHFGLDLCLTNFILIVKNLILLMNNFLICFKSLSKLVSLSEI